MLTESSFVSERRVGTLRNQRAWVLEGHPAPAPAIRLLSLSCKISTFWPWPSVLLPLQLSNPHSSESWETGRVFVFAWLTCCAVSAVRARSVACVISAMPKR